MIIEHFDNDVRDSELYGKLIHINVFDAKVNEFANALHKKSSQIETNYTSFRVAKQSPYRYVFISYSGANIITGVAFIEFIQDNYLTDYGCITWGIDE